MSAFAIAFRIFPRLPPLLLAASVCLAAAVTPATNQVAKAGRITAPQWPVPVNSRLWPAVDRLIERAPLNGRGQLQSGAPLAAVLAQAATAVADHSPGPAERERIRFLLRRGLPEAAAEQLGHLWFTYLDYRADLAQLHDPEDLTMRRQLQRRHFGGVARALFHSENAMLDSLARGARE